MSSNGWPLVPLEELLVRNQSTVSLIPDQRYQEVTIRLWGKGVVLRGVVDGADAVASRRFKVTAGQFIASRIDARNGAMGIVPPELDNAIVTNDFPSFNVNHKRMLPEFLGWLCRTAGFVDMCRAASEGTTNRVRLKEDRFLRLSIPLPPLEEQRRIVSRIDRLAANIDDAKSLQLESQCAIQALQQSLRAREMSRLLKKGQRKITDAVLLERGKFTHRPRNDPRFFGGRHPWIQIGEIESSGKYIENWNQTLNEEGLAISKKFPRGTVLISIAATIGSVGILGFDCCVPDSIVAATPRDGVDAGFVYNYLGYLRTHLEEVAPQSAQKNINLQILSSLPFPDVSIEEQRYTASKIDTQTERIVAATCLSSATCSQLDAMLPSILDRAFKGEL